MNKGLHNIDKLLKKDRKKLLRAISHKKLQMFSPIKHLYRNCRRSAYLRKLEFSLTIEDIIIPEYCPILGIKLKVYSFEDKPNRVKRLDCRPSVDRIDNSKGYIKGNIVICSWRANRLKSNASFTEIRKIYKFLKAHYGKT